MQLKRVSVYYWDVCNKGLSLQINRQHTLTELQHCRWIVSPRAGGPSFGHLRRRAKSRQELFLESASNRRFSLFSLRECLVPQYTPERLETRRKRVAGNGETSERRVEWTGAVSAILESAVLGELHAGKNFLASPVERDSHLLHKCQERSEKSTVETQ
ncbi:hypothetical protein TGPRC2_247260 [Toxoplasma gondii TgCatPRC2]|uniref:Uncharacterized protein n=1 Tax=Toxoplasma gondii TgCatPRC2 TaxID=1130821 RepID=A0A151HG35_TOXGO|nr:hypothetical protein TGPRC2_247260 [Toxoplasma gondii TgCatPRC2]